MASLLPVVPVPSAFFFHCKDFAMKKPRPSSNKPPMAAPMPMPALAPVDRPPLSPLFGAADVEDAGDVDPVGSVMEPVDAVGDAELVAVDAPKVWAILITFGLLSGSVQQSLVSPQHHFADVFVPSHGVTCVFPYCATKS